MSDLLIDRCVPAHPLLDETIRRVGRVAHWVGRVVRRVGRVIHLSRFLPAAAEVARISDRCFLTISVAGEFVEKT